MYIEARYRKRRLSGRDQGKWAFGALQDGTGRVQLFAMERSTPDFESFTGLHLGDWIGVTTMSWKPC